MQRRKDLESMQDTHNQDFRPPIRGDDEIKMPSSILYLSFEGAFEPMAFDDFIRYLKKHSLVPRLQADPRSGTDELRTIYVEVSAQHRDAVRKYAGRVSKRWTKRLQREVHLSCIHFQEVFEGMPTLPSTYPCVTR